MAILAGEDKFEYNFMEKEIEDNPEFFYGLLFDENGNYNDQYIFKPWVFDKLLTSILRNSGKDYGYSYKDKKISQETKEVYFKNIAQLIVSKLNDQKPNKKLVDLFNKANYYISDYVNTKELPILELLKKGFTISSSWLCDFYNAHDKSDMKLLYTIFENSEDKDWVFNKYFNSLGEDDLLKLLHYGLHIDESMLEMYVQNSCNERDLNFSFNRFNFLIDLSVIKNKTRVYEKLLLKLLEIGNLDLLQEFDFSKVDIGSLVGNNDNKVYSVPLDSFIIEKSNPKVFSLLVKNGYQLGYSFYENYIGKQSSRYFMHNNTDTSERVELYCELVNQADLVDDQKMRYYQKAISVASSFSNKTTVYEILNSTNDLSLFEYGMELLIKEDDIIFLMYQLTNGYTPSKNVIRNILDHVNANYILHIVEKSYPKTYEAMLPHLF